MLSILNQSRWFIYAFLLLIIFPVCLCVKYGMMYRTDPETITVVIPDIEMLRPGEEVEVVIDHDNKQAFYRVKKAGVK